MLQNLEWIVGSATVTKLPWSRNEMKFMSCQFSSCIGILRGAPNPQDSQLNDDYCQREYAVLCEKQISKSMSFALLSQQPYPRGKSFAVDCVKSILKSYEHDIMTRRWLAMMVSNFKIHTLYIFV